MGILSYLSKLLIAIQRLIQSLDANTKVLRLKRPGLVFLILTREENNMLFFVLDLPTPGASDVVTRELSVQIGSNTPQNITLTGDVLVSAELSGNDNDVVQGSLVDIDDAGNSSDPSNFSFVLLDTIAPPSPNAVGLTVTREE